MNIEWKKEELEEMRKDIEDANRVLMSVVKKFDYEDGKYYYEGMAGAAFSEKVILVSEEKIEEGKIQPFYVNYEGDEFVNMESGPPRKIPSYKIVNSKSAKEVQKELRELETKLKNVRTSNDKKITEIKSKIENLKTKLVSVFEDEMYTLKNQVTKYDE